MARSLDALSRLSRILSVTGAVLIGLGVLMIFYGAYQTIGGVIPKGLFAAGFGAAALGILMRYVTT